MFLFKKSERLLLCNQPCPPLGWQSAFCWTRRSKATNWLPQPRPYSLSFALLLRSFCPLPFVSSWEGQNARSHPFLPCAELSHPCSPPLFLINCCFPPVRVLVIAENIHTLLSLTLLLASTDPTPSPLRHPRQHLATEPWHHHLSLTQTRPRPLSCAPIASAYLEGRAYHPVEQCISISILSTKLFTIQK